MKNDMKKLAKFMIEEAEQDNSLVLKTDVENYLHGAITLMWELVEWNSFEEFQNEIERLAEEKWDILV